MIYKELIKDLKKVKTYEDISEDVTFELTAATIGAHMQLYLSEEHVLPEEAFEMTRMSILKELDLVMLEMNQMPMDDMDGDIPNIEDLPFGDPLLKNQLTKAFEQYNKRMDS